jgi:5'-deoxynucleotidase YfbR-like HD superfamily hydrolase
VGVYNGGGLDYEIKKMELFRFIEFLHELTKIKRTVKLKGRESLENDAEHSYILAMVAWYIIDKHKLNLNKELVFSYALSHDLVEIYAGDTDPHIHAKEYISSKKEREELALKKINKDFKEFAGLVKTIKKYEKREDPESKLVYLLDKILPAVNTYIAEDSYYSKNGISYDRWRKYLKERIERTAFDDPKFNDTINKIISLLKEKEDMFYKD